MNTTEERTCRVCGCTDLDCSGCIERTGEPCYWVEKDLCSACANIEKKAVQNHGFYWIVGATVEIAKKKIPDCSNEDLNQAHIYEREHRHRKSLLFLIEKELEKRIKERREQGKIKIRMDTRALVIKSTSYGVHSHGWKYLEKGFNTKAELQHRFNELLRDPTYIKG